MRLGGNVLLIINLNNLPIIRIRKISKRKLIYI